jgi:hypothetical protein
MRSDGSRMPDFGDNYLQTGCSVIHFYYSDEERLRFAPFVAEGLLLRQSAVIAGPESFVSDVLAMARPADGRRRIGAVEQVVLQPEVDASLPALLQAIQHASQVSGVVRVVADFSSWAANSIFEIEAALSGACEGLKLLKVTQYEGWSVPAPIEVEQFKTHSLTIVGDAFYYENRDYISPQTYFRKRAAGAGR